MKRKIVALLMISLLMTLVTPFAFSVETYQQYQDRATEVCEAIDMVVGTGEGLTPAYLATTPKRYQGAKLIVGLRGFLSVAEGYGYSENFTDYLDLAWIGGQNILGYLKEHPAIGYNGKPDGSFDPNDDMSVKEYYKLMLVSLGYVENTDFSWSGSASMPDVMEMATAVGLVRLDEADAFTMAKLCVATLEALETTRNGSTETLAAWLVGQGAIDPVVASAYGLFTPASPETAPEAAVEATGYLNYEIALVKGETVVSFTLTNGSFVSDLGEDNAHTRLFLEGFDGDLDTVVSFDSAVDLDHTAVTRLSPSLVTVEIPASQNYRIAEDETVTVSIDPGLIQSAPEGPVMAEFIIADVGAGTIDDPWQLYRFEDLDMMNVEPADYYEINAELSGPGGVINGPLVPRFGGKLNGNGHKIKNVEINYDPGLDPAGGGAGLFGLVLAGGEITNVAFEDISIHGGGAVCGGIAGTDEGGIWTGVRVTDSDIGGVTHGGGLIGRASGHTQITDCDGEGIHVGDDRDVGHAGGVVGHADGGSTLSVNGCSFSGLAITGQNTAGGIVGLNEGGAHIEESHTEGEITGLYLFMTYSSKIGGIAGQSTEAMEILDCSTYGTLTGWYDMGGVLGHNTGTATIDGNYSGIASYRYSFFLSDDPANADIHRILGEDAGTAVLDNTANGAAVLLRHSDEADMTAWVSDPNGLDGQDFEFFLPPTIFEFDPFLPEIPLDPINPGIIWEFDPFFP